ncbi:MAG: hypothetical protein AB2L14_16265 [Candidatus Xenobiia bacterium LiM19]
MKGILEMAIKAMNDRDLVEYESVVDALLRAMCEDHVENLLQRIDHTFICDDCAEQEKTPGIDLCRSWMPEWTFSYYFIISREETLIWNGRHSHNKTADIFKTALDILMMHPEQKVNPFGWDKYLNEMHQWKDSTYILETADIS